MAVPAGGEGSQITNPINRIRWATQRVTGANEKRKRHSILNRFHKRSASTEKRRISADGSHLSEPHKGSDSSDSNGDHAEGSRRIFFNIPLPDNAKDESGRPSAAFARNKVRTAKYTPLSFVPKDLWFQFHNVANVYFLFVVILQVC